MAGTIVEVGRSKLTREQFHLDLGSASRNTQVSPNAGVRGKSNKETALHADRFANLWFFIIIPAHRLT
jgi:hypothetical protein